jgi:hypothetical protein
MHNLVDPEQVVVEEDSVEPWLPFGASE